MQLKLSGSLLLKLLFQFHKHLPAFAFCPHMAAAGVLPGEIQLRGEAEDGPVSVPQRSGVLDFVVAALFVREALWRDV